MTCACTARFVWVGILSFGLLSTRIADAGEPQPAQPPQGASPSTQPADEAKVKEAADRYDRGVKLFEEGDYKLAVVEFDRAYELTGNYQVLYNVGEVNYQLGNYAASKRALLRYLNDGGARISETRRKSVEERLAALKIRTASLHLIVKPGGAQVSIDGVPVESASSDEILVDSGTRRIVATKEGYRDSSQLVTLAGGDELTLNVALTPIPVAPIVETRSVAPEWIAGGATIAFAAAAVGFAFAWQGAQSSLEDEGNRETSRQKLDDLSSSRNTLRTTTFIFGGATLAAGVTTLYFLVRPTAKKSKTSLLPTVGGLMLRGTF